MANGKGAQEFRFVVDGLELSADQSERIGAAIQKAGLEALAAAKVNLTSPLVVGHSSLRLNPEWRGLWVLDGELAGELGPRLEEVLQQQFTR
jgi:hypothetical protein